MKRYGRIIAVVLAVSLLGTSLPADHVISARAKKLHQAAVQENTTGPETAGQPETQVAKPAVNITTDVFDKRMMGKGYEEGKVTVKESKYPSDISLTSDTERDGLMITGDTGAISQMRLDLGAFDFQAYTAGRLIFEGIVERKFNASLRFYLDDEKESFAAVTLSRQKKKNSWDSARFMCADIREKKLTGKHEIYVEPYFEDVKEIGEKTGKTASILLRGILFSEGSTPVVDFHLDESLGTITEMNGDSSHQSECYGEVTVQVPEGYHSEYSDKAFETGTYELDYVRGRGNSTWYSPKKPYKFKLMEKQDFFGMGKNKHWVLLANYYDYTMLRNKYTYWLGKTLGMEYTPECVFVDLVMNGEFLGSYYLCEQVRVGKARVDIDDLEAQKDATDQETISGGYLLSMGDAEERSEQRVIETDHEYRFLIENPEFDTYFNESQYQYIATYLNQLEQAVYGEEYQDENGVSYEEYLDVQAKIDYYWVQEFSLNGDGYLSGSTYLYKKRNGKLYWGPLWDFDYVAWGATEISEHSISDFIHAGRAPWMARLLQNDAFRERLVGRWQRIREILTASIQDGGILDQYAKELYFSQKVNYQVASSTLLDMQIELRVQPYGEEEKDRSEEDLYELDFDQEVARLKRWIRERIQWVDENIQNLQETAGATIRLMVDDTLYAELPIDSEGYFSTYELPADPVKAGYMFRGWYRIDEEGKEVRLSADKYYEVQDEPYVFYAKWRKGTPEEVVQGIQFDQKTYYLPLYEDDDSWKLGLTVMPFDINAEEVTWKIADEKVATVGGGGYLTPQAPGETTVTASYAGKTASCKVVVVKWDEMKMMKDFQVKSKLSVKKGRYAKIPITCSPRKNILYRFNDFHFIVQKPSVVEVDEKGFFYGKKAGKTMVVIYNDSLELIRVCQIEVKGTEGKSSAAKLKASKKTIAKGETYQIKVQKTNGQKVSFSLSKKAKRFGISVTKNGQIKAEEQAKAGTYPVTVKVQKTAKYKAKSLTFYLKVQ